MPDVVRLSVCRRQILRKIVDTKTAMGETLRASAFALTEAKYAAGDFRHTVFDNVGTASVKVSLDPDAATTVGVHRDSPLVARGEIKLHQ